MRELVSSLALLDLREVGRFLSTLDYADIAPGALRLYDVGFAYQRYPSPETDYLGR
jgi:hypothetical protein